MEIGGFQKFSLIDYPEKIAAIVFTQGCNFRCPYCHNPELTVKKEGNYHTDAIIEFLKTRQGKLDGIVITGGEPTLYNDLDQFCSKIKNLGFLVKLDTNGTNSAMIGHLIKNKLVDYIAMDIKTSLNKYQKLTRSKVKPETIKESIELIQNSKVPHEFRTTVVRELIDIEDFKEIAELMKDSKYYLQKFIPSKLLDESFNNMTTYTDEDFEYIMDVIASKNCCIR